MIRSLLVDAFNRDRLSVAQDTIYKEVKLTDGPSSTWAIVGGTKDFRRNPAHARLYRDDGAWFHFTMTGRQTSRGAIEITSYDFELVFPAEHNPSWVRFDFNPPGHENETRDLRSHIHPGNDDILLPAPLMTPTELLELLIDHARPRDPSKPRAP